MYFKYPEVVEITSLGYFLMSRKLKGEFVVQVKTLDEKIILRENLSEKEYEEIIRLEGICNKEDKVNLKLELDFKMNFIKSSNNCGIENINEFLYYNNNTLVSYLGIVSFGGKKTAEINGMTHPDFKRKGLFKKLLDLALEECHRAKYDKILLLCDGKSKSGIKFIEDNLGKYSFSEYRMKANNKIHNEVAKNIVLRKATNEDGKEIVKQNEIYFGQPLEYECFPEEEEKVGQITYMVELKNKIIGKITISFGDGPAFISGVGILPQYRGRGYGKETLKEALRLIKERGINEVELDVECKNDTALSLYKECGFQEQSSMNYYRLCSKIE